MRAMNFLRDARGSTVIETALVAPVLALLALGGYDVSRMVSRQHELAGGAVEMQTIVLAAASGTATDTATIKTALVNTMNLDPSKVTITKVYRCNTSTTLVSSSGSCGASDKVSTYVKVTLTDTYTPTWTKYGVGGPFNYSVTRMVQVS